MSQPAPAAGVSGRTRELLQAPLLPTLLRLATPNVIGLLATTIAIGYDGYIFGRLGADALAGVALVFPLAILMQQMSAGGMGGGITASVARAIGGGRNEEAGQLAQHALLIAMLLAAVFTLAVLSGGPLLYRAMGGKGAALDAALAYSNFLFGGAVVIWLTNTLAAIVRGGGNMVLPSLMLAGTTAIHIVLCPLLVFGAGPLPGLGPAGAALSGLLANGVVAALLLRHLLRAAGPVRLRLARFTVSRERLASILRVGAPASLSPILSNSSIALATALIGSFGTTALAGYGIAARLEFIMAPIAFGFGTALTTLVATNMGAGQLPRALRAAWVGGGVVASITGGLGLIAALEPGWWMNHFSDVAAVREFGAAYLHVVGPAYGLFGLGLALFFASQGAGRMFWPLAGSVARLVCVGLVGWIAVHVLHAGATTFFVIVAAGFVIYALTIAAAIKLGDWARQ